MILHDQDFITEAKKLIESAEHSIDISTFKAEFSKKSRGSKLALFFAAIAAKRRKNVRVRFLLAWNSGQYMTPSVNKNAIQNLKRSDIEVHVLRRNRCCHSKIIIVDRKKAIVGSHNLSVGSIRRNFEVSYLIEDPQHVKDLQSIYDTVYADTIIP